VQILEKICEGNGDGWVFDMDNLNPSREQVHVYWECLMHLIKTGVWEKYIPHDVVNPCLVYPGFCPETIE